MNRVAVITGITGQDGSYLCELLLKKGYTVHGLVRRSSSMQRTRIDSLFHNRELYDERLFLHYADLEDSTTMRRILLRAEPDELYHLAGQSHVGVSFEIPESTCQMTAMGTLRLLEIVRDLPKQPKFLHASSSEIFGRAEEPPQHEQTPMRPVTPYGVAKTFATQMVQVYRDSFGMFACNAICYNHESPRRGESFVTRKITRAAAAIARGQADSLKLGSLTGSRDWGYAPEYVEAMWLMLQHPRPDDFLLATGTSYTVRDFLAAAFAAVELDYEKYLESDPRMQRPSDVARLVGNPAKAASELGWQARTQVPELARIMVQADLEQLN
ncbi:GDP-mannose 4,6-dehydratase [Planctomycetaceae bacterium SH139]